MYEVDVDGTTFIFESSWRVAQYDDWSFFKRKMSLMESKGVDLLALDSSGVLYLIEVKDYTDPDAHAIPIDELPMTVAQKCRDTLAGLFAGAHSAVDDEYRFARQALKTTSLKVILHIELSNTKGGVLRNHQAVRMNLRSKLRAKLKAVDAHADVAHNQMPLGQWIARKTT